MSEGKRPGGLTALAVINFFFGGFGLLGALALAAMLPLMSMAAEHVPPEQREQFEAIKEMGLVFFLVFAGLSLVSGTLLVLSGIGYLKMKRVLGRTVGNLYGVTSIVISLLTSQLMAAELGGGFNLGTVIGLIYPILTLVLINTTFKEDLVR